MGVRSTNSTQSFIDDFYRSGTDASAELTLPISATGGVTATPGDGYKYHFFTSTGPNPFNVTVGGSIEYLLIAGGGSGADRGNGAGGGGAGGKGTASTTVAATAGTANTGGGGGGGGNALGGANGGSGVVIIRYATADATISVGAGLTSSSATDGSDTVVTFTAGTGTVSFS